jgi:ABC-type multidrug transport system fused ATPase/permease subunit
LTASRPTERLDDGMARIHLHHAEGPQAHGDKVILDDVTLNFLPGARSAFVGPTGP